MHKNQKGFYLFSSFFSASENLLIRKKLFIDGLIFLNERYHNFDSQTYNSSIACRCSQFTSNGQNYLQSKNAKTLKKAFSVTLKHNCVETDQRETNLNQKQTAVFILFPEFSCHLQKIRISLHWLT